MPDDDSLLAQGTVDFRDEERRHRGRGPGAEPAAPDVAEPAALFDVAGLEPADAAGSDLVPPATSSRVEFLAGLLSGWTLPAGKTATAAERRVFLAIAENALAEARSIILGRPR